MTVWLVKFVPTTFMVRPLEPAVIVCGETWLMLGISCSTVGVPHPEKEKQSEIPMVAARALNIFKTHL
jgi:hypothetical protein